MRQSSMGLDQKSSPIQTRSCVRDHLSIGSNSISAAASIVSGMLPAIPAADPRTIDLIVVRRVAWISDKVRGLIIYSIYEGESG